MLVHGVKLADVGGAHAGDEEHVVRDGLDLGRDVLAGHEGVDVVALVLGVDLGLADAVLVLVEGGGQRLVVLDVLQLVAEAVQRQVIARRRDGEAREALRDLLLEKLNIRPG